MSQGSFDLLLEASPLGGVGAGKSTWDVAAVGEDVIGASALAACSVSLAGSIIMIVGVSVSTGPGRMGGGFGQGIRYWMGSLGAVFEVARVAADRFDLKVAESPFSSPRIPLISGQR